MFFAALLSLLLSINLLAQSNVSKEEYAIYAVVLKDIYTQKLKEQNERISFVILDSTIKDLDFSVYENLRIRGLLNNFKARNQTPAALEGHFPIKYEYTLVNKTELEEFWEKEKAEKVKLQKEAQEKNKGVYILDGSLCPKWKYFYEKYPNSNGYYEFSRIGFSTNKNFALLEVKGEGSCWNSNTTYILKKINKRWAIYRAFGGFGIA